MSTDASPNASSKMTAAVPVTPDPALVEDLVAANRILSDHGVLDAYGHISARDTGNPRYYWISRSMAPALVTTTDIIACDLDNNPVRPGETRLFFERVIHGEIYRARPHVMAVLHNQGDLNICTIAQAKGLVQALGRHCLVLLRGHGAVAVGSSIRQVVRRAIIAESNAKQQIQATLLGPVQFLTPSEIEYARRMKPKDPDRAWQLWKQQAMRG
jgi:ribulose-5-phosphate 4-epimerase/fuculose-1-phosphate aldolase